MNNFLSSFKKKRTQQTRPELVKLDSVISPINGRGHQETPMLCVHVNQAHQGFSSKPFITKTELDQEGQNNLKWSEFAQGLV